MYVLSETESKKGTWTVNILVYSLQLNAIKDAVLALQEFIKDSYEETVIDTIQEQGTFIETVSSKSYDIVYYDISGRNSKEDVNNELQSFRLFSPETEEFSIVGYKVHAYDYIVLSEEKDGLLSSFVRIMREKYNDDNVSYSVRMKGVWRRLNVKEIVYMETNDHHVLFHMNNGQTYKTLANFKSLTPPIGGRKDLFQCHKSYVVNGRYVVDMVQNSFLTQDGRKISISKPNRKNARSFYSWCVMNGYVEMAEEADNKKRP